MLNSWDEHQAWEAGWWGNCTNTFEEETKQLVYAQRMGLATGGGRWPTFDVQGKSILDIGGGPTSLLLKCHALGPDSAVVDPCAYPAWVEERYRAAGIRYLRTAAEDLDPASLRTYDECWIYNVLQHVRDPEAILVNARAVAKVVRLFEWIDLPVSDGHPHELKRARLEQWLGGHGQVEALHESGCYGSAFYGTFAGR